MVENEIAHRDLKSDNILIDRAMSYDIMGQEDTASSNYHFPHLVISDFGCCLADSKVGLKLPFTSFETDRGGNVALMAPEVYNAEPGMFSSIDYSKSDVWSAGAIAYELFGAPNPFYGDRNINAKGVKRNLFNRSTASSGFPPLPSDTPPLIVKLINQMLERNPSKRMTAKEAANICQLLLWAPSSWTKIGNQKNKRPSIFSRKYNRSESNGDSLVEEKSTHDILQWLLTLTTKIIYEARFPKRFEQEENLKRQHDGYEYQLVATFLSRIQLHDIKSALNWIQQQM
jgi:serine/threonine protein kinase